MLYLHSIAQSHEKILFWVLKTGKTCQYGITLVPVVNTTIVPLAPSYVTAIGPWHHTPWTRVDVNLRAQKYNQQNPWPDFQDHRLMLRKAP